MEKAPRIRSHPNPDGQIVAWTCMAGVAVAGMAAELRTIAGGLKS